LVSSLALCEEPLSLGAYSTAAVARILDYAFASTLISPPVEDRFIRHAARDSGTITGAQNPAPLSFVCSIVLSDAQRGYATSISSAWVTR
jgi:hypothetical protein